MNALSSSSLSFPRFSMSASSLAQGAATSILNHGGCGSTSVTWSRRRHPIGTRKLLFSDMLGLQIAGFVALCFPWAMLATRMRDACTCPTVESAVPESLFTSETQTCRRTRPLCWPPHVSSPESQWHHHHLTHQPLSRAATSQTETSQQQEQATAPPISPLPQPQAGATATPRGTASPGLNHIQQSDRQVRRRVSLVQPSKFPLHLQLNIFCHPCRRPCPWFLAGSC